MPELLASRGGPDIWAPPPSGISNVVPEKCSAPIHPPVRGRSEMRKRLGAIPYWGAITIFTIAIDQAGLAVYVDLCEAKLVVGDNAILRRHDLPTSSSPKP